MTNLRISEKEVNQRYNDFQFAMISTYAIAIICLFMPALNPRNNSAGFKFASLLTSLICFSGNSYLSRGQEKRKQIKDTIASVGYEDLKTQLIGTDAHTQMTLEAEAKVRLANELWVTYPETQARALAAEYGVFQLLPLPVRLPSPAIDPNTYLPDAYQDNEPKDWEGIERESALPEERDCAKDLMELDGHICIASKTGSGKTTLLVAAILYAIEAGHEVYLIDGKGDIRLQALGDRGANYLRTSETDKTPAFIHLLKTLARDVGDRQMKKLDRPISIFIDEYNCIRSTAEERLATDLDKKAGANRREEIESAIRKITLQGRSAKVYLRIASHSSRVEDLGINTAIQDSWSYMAIARDGKYESLADLIRHQFEGQLKEIASRQLSALSRVSIEAPIILTKIHPIGFYRLPLYKLPASIENYVPEEESIEESIEDTQKDESDPDAYHRLAEWRRSNPGASASDLKNKYKEEFRKNIPDDKMSILIQYLDRLDKMHATTV